MTTIGIIVRRVVSRVAGIWEQRAALSRGQTYEAARAELGGAPWREVPKSTDAWYILDEEAAAMGPAATEGGRLRIVAIGLPVAASLAFVAFLAWPRSRAVATLPAAVVATAAQPATAAATASASAPATTAPAATPTAAPVGAAAPVLTPAPARHLAHGKPKHHPAAKSPGTKHARR
jgi:hypothetical protein